MTQVNNEPTRRTGAASIRDRLPLFAHAGLAILMLVPPLAFSRPAFPLSDPARTPAETQNLASLRQPTHWWAAVQQDLLQREYRVAWQESPLVTGGPPGYQAPNRAHNLRVGFYPTGVQVVERNATRADTGGPQDNAWVWGLTLTGYGYEDDLRQASQAAPVAQANRVEYRRSRITEWYVNDERGVEHGFQISDPESQQTGTAREPNPEGRIVLEIEMSGDLSPRPIENGQALELTDGDGTPVLRYGLTQASGATGRPVPAQLHVTETRFFPENLVSCQVIRIAVDTDDATYPITLHLTLTSLERAGTRPAPTELGWAASLPSDSDWIGESNQDNARLGQALSTAGDVNGDGYSDLVVGAPHYDGGYAEEGAAFVYYGGPAGLTTTGPWHVHPTDQANAHFGAAVSIAGDVNGDGYPDVIIGAPDYDGTQADAGAAFVYYGSAAGPATGTADWARTGEQGDAHFGSSVSTAGDVNGDGYSDIVIGAPDYSVGITCTGAAFVYLGSSGGPTTGTADWTGTGDQDNGQFGAAVSGAGDVNGDGYADVIVGAPNYDGDQTNEGAAFVYQGGPAAPLTTTLGTLHPTDQENAHFGATVSGAGDVNGDGYADIIVGVPNYDGDQADEGAAFVYRGGPGWPLAATPWIVHPTDQENAHFGAAVSAAGDVNGDGYADVVIGAPDYDDAQGDEGAAFVYRGGAGGLAITPVWSAHPTDQGDAHFGISVSVAGDVNGDGHADLAIGATGYDHEQTDEGGAFVYHGRPEGLAASQAWDTTSGQAGALLGWSVSTAGDVDGDGYGDILVGAPRYDHGQPEEGVAFLYTGGPDGPASDPVWMGESDQPWAWYGYAVAVAGDVDNDGYSDIVVGAPRYDVTGTVPLSDSGQAFVYTGGPTGPLTTTAWTASPTNQADARFGSAVSAAGDVNGDGYADLLVTANGYDDAETNEGAAFVYLGGTTGLDASPAWVVHPTDQAYANFGRSASTAGDVNGDGYSDVIIGAPWYEYPNNETGLDGTAYVYHGSASGLSELPDWTVTEVFTGAEFGIAVSTAGDVNGDGYSDVIVGAYKYTEIAWMTPWREGAALAYHGSAGGLSEDPDWIVTSGQESAKFGLAVSNAGDTNGDGYGDVIVGAPNYADGEAQEGIAYVYTGKPEGLSTSPDWSTQGSQQGAGYGFSVAGAGDVNGDGYGDVIVSAPTYNRTQLDAGSAFVYLGNGEGGLPVRPRQLQSDGSAPIAPLGRSDAAGQVGLEITARTPLGRGLAKLEWQLAPLGTAFTATTAITGTSSAWSDVLTTGVPLSQTVAGLTGGTVYRWRARLLYPPGDRLGLVGSRWLYMPWNGPQEADFRTPGALAPESKTQFFLPFVLRGAP